MSPAGTTPSTAAAEASAPGKPAVSTERAAAWRERADAADWAAIRADLDAHGCALAGPLLTRTRRARSRRSTPTTPGSARPSAWGGTASVKASTATSPSRSLTR